MGQKPLCHTVLVAYGYPSRGIFLQRRGGIFHRIAFLGDTEHGNIIQGIMSVVENDTYTDVTLDLRYKNTGSSEWVYAESKTQKFGDGDDEGWIITKIPTCTENGEKTRYIEDEDIYETEVIPATGHSLQSMSQMEMPHVRRREPRRQNVTITAEKRILS